MNTRLELRVSMVCRVVACLAIAGLVAACSAGSGGQPQENPPPANNPSSSPTDTACNATNAIEGGGRRLAGVVSEVDGAHVTVSKVRFDAAAAKIYVDDEPATVSSLRTGEVVSVTGSVDLNAETGCAAAISADAIAVGAIETVNAAPYSPETFTMLGLEVHVDANTVFGSDVQPAQLSSLQPGDVIRLSGLHEDVGIIRATRIDRAAGGYAVAGVVTHLDTQNRKFRVNDATFVEYADAVLAGFPTGEVREGDAVRVTGTAFDDGGFGFVVLRPNVVSYTEHGTTFTVFPDGYSMERGYYAYFTASSGPNSVTWSIVHADGRACTADECGTIDPATGEYVAAIFVGGATRFLVIATSIIDPSDSVAVPLYVSDDRQLTGGPNTVQGQVYSAEAGPVPGLVTVWVDPADRIPYVGFDAKTDELGNFMIRNLPDATVYLTAWSGDHSQPCVTTIDVQGDVNASVELMPASAFDRVDAPRPQSSVLPTWSGTIYETTPNGRQPIYGVSLVVHLFMWDNVVAYTLSDRGGKYFLCNLGPYMWMQVGKAGYSTKTIGIVDPDQSHSVDIELVRE